jgi:molecular chaperone HscB
MPDYFEFFGLERKLSIDPDDLQRRFYRLSRELHPDRFTRAAPGERSCALEASAMLNDAYRTLRDPAARAEYLLGTAGNGDAAPPELLEEVFEANEALASMDRAEIEGARERFRKRLAETDAELSGLFPVFDAGEPVGDEIRTALSRRRFLLKLVQRLENV